MKSSFVNGKLTTKNIQIVVQTILQNLECPQIEI